MPSAPTGLHHVTAIATDPQRNVDFYHAALGLRLVKRTVNFDSPGTYHLYFGDESGSPGTLITFFPWPDAPRGRHGAGQATTVAFSVPEGSLGWWRDHFEHLPVPATISVRAGEEVLSVRDPDGLSLELVAHPQPDTRPAWEDGPIPPRHAIRGMHSVTLTEVSHEHTAELFTRRLGFQLIEESSNRFRFATGDAGSGALVDVLCCPEAPQGLVAAGTVHHIAWRNPDDAEQVEWRELLLAAELNVTPVLDRQYFRSIYFREPGGVLLEMATDLPGFTVDEPLMALGRSLRLPPWLEPSREEIERSLPTLTIPDSEEQVAIDRTERERAT